MSIIVGFLSRKPGIAEGVSIPGFLLDIVRGAAAWRSATAGMTQNVTAREWVDSTRQLEQTGARGTTKKEGQ